MKRILFLLILALMSVASWGAKAIPIPLDMTQPDDEIKPLLSAVYENLGLAVDYFERSFGE